MSRSAREVPTMNIHRQNSEPPKNLPQTVTTASSTLDDIDPTLFEETFAHTQDKNKPLFTVDDLRTTMHPLAQIIRLMCILDNISKEELRDRHRRISLRTYTATNKITEEFNNLSRAVLYPRITWDFFHRFLTYNNYELVDLVVILKDRDTGQLTEFKKSDVIRYIKDNPPTEYQYPPYPSVNSPSTLTPKQEE